MKKGMVIMMKKLLCLLLCLTLCVSIALFATGCANDDKTDGGNGDGTNQGGEGNTPGGGTNQGGEGNTPGGDTSDGGSDGDSGNTDGGDAPGQNLPIVDDTETEGDVPTDTPVTGGDDNDLPVHPFPTA